MVEEVAQSIDEVDGTSLGKELVRAYIRTQHVWRWFSELFHFVRYKLCS